MNEISDLLRRALAWSIALLLMLAGAVFAVSLFLALLLLAVFGFVGALLSGRKPAPLVLWSRWRAMRSRSPFFAAGRGGVARSGAAGTSDVVDVEAREVGKSSWTAS